LAVRTELPASKVLRLNLSGSGRFDPFAPAEDLTLRPSGGPGCLLFRLSDVRASYVEMVHPVDFYQDTLIRTPAPGDGVRLRHQLFRDSLEKGVILRARVRGAFLLTDDDASVAAGCYEAFAAEKPPLST
jgi:hypothetical protein